MQHFPDIEGRVQRCGGETLTDRGRRIERTAAEPFFHGRTALSMPAVMAAS